VARAKLFAAAEYARKQVDKLWDAFVLRLWSSDERLQALALSGEASELAWFVQQAAERLTKETVTVFAVVPDGRVRADLRDGENLVLPVLSTLTADPGIIWRMVESGATGTVLKVHLRSARPSWRFSVCPEEQERMVGDLTGVKLVVRRTRNGTSPHFLFRGQDIASRTFGSSQVPQFPLVVPDAVVEPCYRVHFVEAEEVEEEKRD